MAINLQKGQKISLSKETDGGLSKVIMGLGWDAKKPLGGLLKGLFAGKKKGIDLDASCFLFDENKKSLDSVYFKRLKSHDGSVVHTGDNRTGDGEGDDEQIIVHLDRVPENVKSLIFTVNSFSGETFDTIENAYCRLVDTRNDKEIARYTLSAQGPHTGQIMVKLYRHNNEWKMHAIGEVGEGRMPQDMLPQIVVHL